MSKNKRRSGTRPKPKLVVGSSQQAKAKKEVARQFSWRLVAGLAVVLVVIAGAGFAVLTGFFNSSKAVVTVGQPLNIGSVDCRETPKFVQDLHFATSPAFSTSERNIQGLALVEGGANGQNRIYQKPSWTKAGYLAPIQFGKSGNVFVAPAPFINTLFNPPDAQNELYRVDSVSGEMNQFVTLPRAAPPTPENPFGVLGLSYDCETNKLYAASVAGSTRAQEVGRLYEIDADTAAVLSEFDAVDPLGMAVFNGTKGKRLYYGLARWPEIWSIALDSKGAFQGQPRLEISLANIGPRGTDKARRLEISPTNQLSVSGVEFSFNLIAPTERQETIYRFDYDKVADKWTYVPNQPG